MGRIYLTRDSLYSAFSLQFPPVYMWFYLNLSTKYDTIYINLDQRELSGVERIFNNVTAQTQKRLSICDLECTSYDVNLIITVTKRNVKVGRHIVK